MYPSYYPNYSSWESDAFWAIRPENSTALWYHCWHCYYMSCLTLLLFCQNQFGMQTEKKKEAWTIPRASLINHFVSRYLCECGIREHTLFLRLWVSKRRSHGHGVPVWHVRWRHGDESGASYTALWACEWMPGFSLNSLFTLTSAKLLLYEWGFFFQQYTVSFECVHLHACWSHSALQCDHMSASISTLPLLFLWTTLASMVCVSACLHRQLYIYIYQTTENHCKPQQIT